MKKYIKNIKDIQSMEVKGGSQTMILTRINDNEFEASCRSDTDWICDKCGAYLTVSNEQDHYDCKYEIHSEEKAADIVMSLFGEDEKNIILINKGLDDEIYLHLG